MVNVWYNILLGKHVWVLKMDIIWTIPRTLGKKLFGFRNCNIKVLQIKLSLMSTVDVMICC
jgi:hypothetical protein